MDVHEELTAAAERLGSERGAVLEGWIEDVRRRVWDGHEPTSAIRDEVPRFLELLEAALGRGSLEELQRELRAFAAEHAHNRDQLLGFELEDVFQEYRLLRRRVFACLDGAGCARAAPVRDLVHEAFDHAIGASAERFVELQFGREAAARREALAAAGRLRDLQAVTEAALVSRVGSDVLLREVLAHLQRAFEADAVFVYLADGEGGLRLAAAKGLHAAPRGGFEPLGDDAVSRAFRSGEPLVVTSEEELEGLPGSLRAEGLRCVLGVDLRLPDERLGVVGVARRPDGERRRWGDDDRLLLGLIADRLAVAVEHARLYEAMSQSVTRLEEERDLRERFVVSLVHDMRGPLSAVVMQLELLARKTNEPEAVARAVEAARRNVRRIDRFTRNLLDANGLTAGQPLRLETARVDLSAVVAGVCHEFNLTLGAPLCRFVDEEEPVVGAFSADALERILQNLIQNALRHGAEGVPVTVRVERRPDRARLSVHNEGSEIPAADRERIFELLGHRDRGEEGRGAGWGIGLFVVRALVEAQNGVVWVESGEGQGTTFVVELPLPLVPPSGG